MAVPSGEVMRTSAAMVPPMGSNQFSSSTVSGPTGPLQPPVIQAKLATWGWAPFSPGKWPLAEAPAVSDKSRLNNKIRMVNPCSCGVSNRMRKPTGNWGCAHIRS